MIKTEHLLTHSVDVSIDCGSDKDTRIIYHRIRTSGTHSVIEITLIDKGGTTQTVTFSKDRFGDAYEQVALEFAEHLSNLTAKYTCMLPKES